VLPLPLAEDVDDKTVDVKNWRMKNKGMDKFILLVYVQAQAAIKRQP